MRLFNGSTNVDLLTQVRLPTHTQSPEQLRLLYNLSNVIVVVARQVGSTLLSRWPHIHQPFDALKCDARKKKFLN